MDPEFKYWQGQDN